MKKLLLSLAFLPIFLFVASPAFASSFSDTFTDSDGTTLHAHNNLWDCNFNSEAVIQSNKAASSGPNSQTCLANSFQNGSISTLVNFPGSSSEYSSYVALRYQDSNNYYFCNLNANDGFVIFKLYQGNLTVLDNVSGSVGSGDHTLLCSISGSTITLTVDGIQRVQVTDTDLPNAGRGGMQLTPGITIDDYNSINDDEDTNESPSVGIVTVSPNPVTVNTSVFASTNFTDANTLDTHTATIDWGDGSGTQICSVTESNGSGSVSCTKTAGYTTANVYPATITVSDGSLSNTSPVQYVSVYAPTQSSIFTAGHRFTSPVGAYPQNTNLTGNATFGLSYKYQGSMPVGMRQFSMDFNQANLHFNATSVTSLVVSNGKATLQGTGTINGSGTYNFLVVGVDGGGIRIKITEGTTVIYDTQMSATDDATPTTSVNGQVIVQ